MKMKAVFFSLFIAFGSLLATVASAQDEDVRGAFMTTRPKASGKGTNPAPTAKASHRRPKTRRGSAGT